MKSSVASMIIAFCASMGAVSAAPSSRGFVSDLRARQHDVDRWGVEVIPDTKGSYCPRNVIVDGLCTQTIDYAFQFCPDSEKIADDSGKLFCTPADADGRVCRDGDKGDYDSPYPDICTSWDSNHVLCATKSLVDGLCPAKTRRQLHARQHDVDRWGIPVVADSNGIDCPENFFINGACTETADSAYEFCKDSEKIGGYCTTADKNGLVCKDKFKGDYGTEYPDVCTSWDSKHVLCATKDLVGGLCPGSRLV